MTLYKRSRQRLLTLSLTLVLLTGCFAYGDVFYGGRTSGQFSYYLDQSALEAGYGPHFKEAANAWNGINDKVKLTESGNSKGADRYYVGYSQVEGLLGAQVPYVTDFFGRPKLSQSSEPWQFSAVILYQNNMNQYGLTYQQRVSSAIHEIGHSLSLAHPSGSEPSVMRQGISDLKPTSYDRATLNERWTLHTSQGQSPKHSVSVAANYNAYTEVPQADANADLILIATPQHPFDIRYHVVNQTADGTIMDFYTLTQVKVQRLIKAPADFKLGQDKLMKVVEPISVLKTEKDVTTLSYEDYNPMAEGQTYLIFLRKNNSGRYSVMNMSLGAIDIQPQKMLMKATGAPENSADKSLPESASLSTADPAQTFINAALSQYVKPSDLKK